MPLAQKGIEKLDQQQLLKLLEREDLEIVVEEKRIKLTYEKAQIDQILHESLPKCRSRCAR